MIYIATNPQETDIARAMELVSPQRREEALRYRNEAHRRLSLAAYLLLMRALREEYGITEPPVFEYASAHGKPSLAGHPEIHFNMSHCREAVACVVAAEPVGIDVESCRDMSRAVIRKVMNEREQAMIAQAANPAMEFTRMWTMKESYLKCTGTGLTVDPKDILADTDPARFVTRTEPSFVCTAYCPHPAEAIKMTQIAPHL